MLSRSARITLLLVIDICFFFVELIIGQKVLYFPPWAVTNQLHPGYAVGSLALVADSFHMLKYAISVLMVSEPSVDFVTSVAMS
jgi:zinc transporter 1